MARRVILDTDRYAPERVSFEEPPVVTIDRFRVTVPAGISILLEDLITQVVIQRPGNINIFAADFFNHKLQQRSGVQDETLEFGGRVMECTPYGWQPHPVHTRVKKRAKPNPAKGISLPPAMPLVADKTKKAVDQKKDNAPRLDGEDQVSRLERKIRKSTRKTQDERIRDLCTLPASEYPFLEDDVHRGVFPVKMRKLCTGEDKPEIVYVPEKPAADDIYDGKKGTRSIGIQETNFLCVPPPQSPLERQPSQAAEYRQSLLMKSLNWRESLMRTANQAAIGFDVPTQRPLAVPVATATGRVAQMQSIGTGTGIAEDKPFELKVTHSVADEMTQTDSELEVRIEKRKKKKKKHRRKKYREDEDD